jgi:hypothetical protein
MILERKELRDKETSEIFVEALYDSSNIIKSIYLPAKKTLFIIFKKGVVYSYANVDPELYVGFENSDSQGVYFSKNIAKNTNCYYYKEYKLYDFEKKEIFGLIEERKSILNEEKNKI